MELANEVVALKKAAARGLVEQDVVPAMHCHGVDREVLVLVPTPADTCHPHPFTSSHAHLTQSRIFF